MSEIVTISDWVRSPVSYPFCYGIACKAMYKILSWPWQTLWELCVSKNSLNCRPNWHGDFAFILHQNCQLKVSLQLTISQPLYIVNLLTFRPIFKKNKLHFCIVCWSALAILWTGIYANDQVIYSQSNPTVHAEPPVVNTIPTSPLKLKCILLKLSNTLIATLESH